MRRAPGMGAASSRSREVLEGTDHRRRRTELAGDRLAVDAVDVLDLASRRDRRSLPGDYGGTCGGPRLHSDIHSGIERIWDLRFVHGHYVVQRCASTARAAADVDDYCRDGGCPPSV